VAYTVRKAPYVNLREPLLNRIDIGKLTCEEKRGDQSERDGPLAR
jgi:hypothetical protein